jgi:hypothetical protein
MKPNPLIAPLAALLVAWFWLASQNRAISSVQARTALLQAKIATARNSPAGSLLDGQIGPRGASGGKSAINWSRFAENTGYGVQGLFAKQETLRVRKKIEAMTPGELFSALGEVRDLEIRSRGQIEKMLLTSLGRKDPAAALDYLINPDNAHLGLDWGVQTSILAAWAKNDAASSTAWLDERIASGKFESKQLDGKNFMRSQCEAAMIYNFIGTDPAAATSRLSALPEVHRAEVVQNILFQIRTSGHPCDDGTLAAYSILIRENLPAIAQTQSITAPVPMLMQQGGYERVAQYLELAAASPEERSSAVGKAGNAKFGELAQANKLTVGEIDAFRQWVATQAPDAMDSSTSQVLVSAGLKNEGAFNQAVEIALHYQETNGNDDILYGFLKSISIFGDKEKVRILTGKIADPVRREEILKSLQ